jgi:hypothetical protein
VLPAENFPVLEPKMTSLTKHPLAAFALTAALAALSPAPAQDSPAAAASATAEKETSGIDEDLLAKAEKMTAAELRELFQLYERKNAPEMRQRIAALLLKADPSDAAARSALGAVPAENPPNTDDPPADGAAQQPAQTNQTAPAPEPAAILKARKLQSEGNAAQAVAEIQAFQAAQPKNAPFAYQMDLASALDDAGRTAEAAEAYRKIANDPQVAAAERADAAKRLAEIKQDGALQEADAALDKGDVATARTLLRRADPDNPERKLLEGRILLASGNATAAEQAFQKLSLDSALPPDVRKDAAAAQKEARVERLLGEGENAMRHDRTLALSISEELYQLAPQRSDVVAFRAQALLKNGKSSSAVNLLETHGKNTTDDDSHALLLAEALEKCGSLRRAAAAYRTAAEKSGLSPQEAASLLDAADTLAAFGSPRLAADWRFVDAAEGQWSALHADAQTGILESGLRFTFEGTWDNISLEQSAFSSQARSDLAEGAVSAFFHGSRQLFAKAGVSGHADGVGFSVAAGRLPLAGPGVQLRYDHAQRATDSLALRALNGRQNKVSASVQADLSAVAIDASLYWREIDIDGHDVGDGWGFELSLSRQLLEETASLPGLSLAYLGEFSDFNRRTSRGTLSAIGLADDGDAEAMAELVDHRINRHELQLSVQRHWTQAVRTVVSGAAGREFEDEETVWRAAFLLEMRLSPSSRLLLEAEYDSSGQARNSANAVRTLRAGMSIDF